MRKYKKDYNLKLTTPLQRFVRISTIDIYLIKKYFTTLFFAFFAIAIISVAIDFSEKTDDFLSEKLEDKTLIIFYFLNFIPTILAVIAPFFVFITVIFFTSRMAMRTEFVPMLTSGLSLFDILKPYLLGGVIVGTLFWGMNQSILPKMNTNRIEFLDKYVHRVKSLRFSNYYLRTGKRDYFTIKRFDTSLKKGYEVSFFQLDTNLAMKLMVQSSVVKYDPNTHKWIMQKAVYRKINKTQERVKSVDSYELPFTLKLDEVLFVKVDKVKMTSREIRRYIEREKFRGKTVVTKYEHEYHSRIAVPFTIIIMSLMGCIISYRKVRGGSGFQLAVGIVLGAIYFMLERISSVFSANLNFNPLIAAWFPNIIFIFVTFYLYLKSSK